MKIASFALATALIAGGASAQQAGTPDVQPGAQSFTGWVKVVNGEIQLYGSQRDIQRPFARPCTSVVLPRDLQRAAGDLSGTQVRFSGASAPWIPANGPVMAFKGSRVANDCGGETVIQAETYRVLGGG